MENTSAPPPDTTPSTTSNTKPTTAIRTSSTSATIWRSSTSTTVRRCSSSAAAIWRSTTKLNNTDKDNPLNNTVIKVLPLQSHRIRLKALDKLHRVVTGQTKTHVGDHMFNHLYCMYCRGGSICIVGLMLSV
eukprot:UN13037